MAEAREIDLLIERATARSTDAFAAKPREASTPDAQFNLPTETSHSPSSPSGAHMEHIGQRSALQHAPGDGATTTERNQIKQLRAGAERKRVKERYPEPMEAAEMIVVERQLEATTLLQERKPTERSDKVNHFLSTVSLTQQGTASEVSMSDVPSSYEYERQVDLTGKYTARSGAGMQLVSISSDHSLPDQSANPIQARVSHMSQTESGYRQTPMQEAVAQGSQVSCLPDVSSSHVTTSAGQLSPLSNVSAAQASQDAPIPKPLSLLDKEALPVDLVHVSMTPALTMRSHEDPSLVESFTSNLMSLKRLSSTGATERKEPVKDLKAEPEVRTTRRQRQNARGYAKKARKAQLAANEYVKLMEKPHDINSPGEDYTQNGQKEFAKYENYTSNNCAIPEGLQAQQEPGESEKLDRGHDSEPLAQDWQDGPPEDDLQSEQKVATEETTQEDKSDATQDLGANPEVLHIQQEAALKKRLNKEETAARLALEELKKAETANTEAQSVETANAASPNNGSGDKSRFEKTATRKRPDKRTRMKLQQQDLEAQRELATQQFQVTQSSFIYDTIEKTDIPYNLSQLETIASGLAEYVGQVKQINVTLPATCHNQSQHRIQAPHQHLHNAIQCDDIPENLNQLQFTVSRFAKHSTKILPSSFLRYNSTQDAAYYKRLMEDTGLPLVDSKKCIEQQHNIALPFFQADPSVPSTTTLAHSDSPKGVSAVLENTRISGDQVDKQLRHQDALLSLLNFVAALPTTAEYTYTDVLAKASADAVQAYNQSAPFLKGNVAAVKASSFSAQGSAPSTLSKKALRKARQGKKMEELEKRVRVLEVENRFLKGMHDEEMQHEARVQV
jgi:hypothetical protein